MPDTISAIRIAELLLRQGYLSDKRLSATEKDGYVNITTATDNRQVLNTWVRQNDVQIFGDIEESAGRLSIRFDPEANQELKSTLDRIDVESYGESESLPWQRRRHQRRGSCEIS